MKNRDNIKRFATLRQRLRAERGQIRQRIAKLEAALENVSPPSLSPVDGATSSAKELAGSRRALSGRNPPATPKRRGRGRFSRKRS